MPYSLNFWVHGQEKTLSSITERFMRPGITKDVKHMPYVWHGRFSCYAIDQKGWPCDAPFYVDRKMWCLPKKWEKDPHCGSWAPSDSRGISMHGTTLAFILSAQYHHPHQLSASKCILTISDYFTKFVEAFPMESKHAEGCCHTVQGRFCISAIF